MILFVDFKLQVFATNRGVCQVRGTESSMGAKDGIYAPHGLPVDLLDRLMIIKTAMYNASELREIIKLRSKAEGVDITQDALAKVAEVLIIFSELQLLKFRHLARC